MLRKFLFKLFHTDDLDGEYRAKPGHIIYSLLMMGMGARLWFYSGLEWLGNAIVILGFLFGIVIMMCLNWDKSIQYWDRVGNVLDTLHKVNNPEVWKWAYLVFGVDAPNLLDKVTVVEKIDDNHWKRQEIDISPEIMNQLGNKVIYNLTANGSLDFTEEMYGNLVPKKVRKKWIKENKLVPKNPKNPRNGYRVSRKLYDMCYQFASEHMKLRGE